jgi:cytochrome c peroxidase
MRKIALLYCVGLIGVLASCQPETQTETEAPLANQAILETFGNKINPSALPNYANQAVPNYIRKDNTGNNPITDEKAILGRVLFYDKNLGQSRCSRWSGYPTLHALDQFAFCK